MSLHVLLFVAKWKRQERRKIGSKESMETPCSQLINRGTGLPRAGPTAFPEGQLGTAVFKAQIWV